jgi:AcrR family transcriptional regulator
MAYPFPAMKALPRGINSLPRRQVQKEQRKRLIEGTAYAVAERGYAATAVSHILARAGVSRAAFYELFRDKEECFLYGFKEVSRGHLEAARLATEAAGSLPEQLYAGATAYLQVLDLDPALSRAFVVEAEAASPAIRAAFARAGDALEQMIRTWFERVREAHPDVPECSALTLRTLRAGFTGTLIGLIRDGQPRLGADVGAIARFTFATLGLYAWARQAEAGRIPTGPPR